MAEKLVRDKVPPIIESKGEVVSSRVLSHEEYLIALDEKLQEEVAEYLASKEMVELADIMEVVRAIATARGSSPEQVEALRVDKLAERGGFSDQIALQS